MTPSLPKVRARRQTARQAVLLLEEFCTAIGQDAVYAAFGWDRAKDGYSPDERFYVFTHGKVRVGWATMHLLTKDPDDEEAVISRGVFPEHQRKGYAQAMAYWLASEAVRLGATRMTRTVKRINERHSQRSLEEAKGDVTPWIYAGHIWYPAPGYDYFVWPLERPAPAPPEAVPLPDPAAPPSTE